MSEKGRTGKQRLLIGVVAAALLFAGCGARDESAAVEQAAAGQAGEKQAVSGEMQPEPGQESAVQDAADQTAAGQADAAQATAEQDDAGQTAAEEADEETAEIHIEPIEGLRDDFIRGVDISSVLAEEESGVVYFNEAGQEQDIFQTFF